jgi:hypothetical protein
LITSKTLSTNISFKTDPRESHTGLSSVFAAAVVNQNFRHLLLNDPETALKSGYLGKDFSLSREETMLIVSINASSLTDLAKQVVQTLGKELI